MKQYYSKDFSKVGNVLKAQIPDKLLHKNVMVTPDQDDDRFSQERQHLVKIVDLPSKTMSMTIGGLEPKQSTRLHRHNYETLIYIIKGVGKSIIEEQEIFWEQGDAIYVPVWAWHQHINLSETDECLYIASENAPLLQNLGGLALREESK